MYYRIGTVGIVGFIVLLLATSASGESAAVSGTWFDQDKTHLASEPDSGDSWTHNWYSDANGNGSYDPGESWDDEVQPGWIYAEDNSCWMASAGNVVQYMGGGNPYYDWAYNGTYSGLFGLQTFENGGDATDLIESLGYTTQNIGGAWEYWFGWGGDNPADWMLTQIQQDSPLAISIGIVHPGLDSRHELTVYGVDITNQSVAIADSDTDYDDFRTCAYAWDGDNFRINLYGHSAAEPESWEYMYHVASVDMTGRSSSWIGSGTSGDSSTTGNTTRWTNPDNWSTGHSPIVNDDAHVVFTGTGQVNVDCLAKASSLSITNGAKIRIDDGYSLTARTQTVGSNAYVEQTGGVHRVSEDYNIIGYPEGTVIQTGGVCDVGGSLYVAHGYDSFGVYELRGNSQLYASNIYVGYGEISLGRLLQSGGINTVVGDLMLGIETKTSPYYEYASGTYELSGGRLVVGGSVLGFSGGNSFVLTGGVMEVAGDISVRSFQQSGGSNMAVTLEIDSEQYPISGAVYGLSGNGELSADYQYIGNKGTGRMLQSGGTNTASGNLFLGKQSGSKGIYELGGDGWLIAKSEFIGFYGMGTFTQIGGTNTADVMSVGSYSGDNCAYGLSGGVASIGELSMHDNGSFALSGGLAEIGYLSMHDNASFTYSGGQLSVDDGMEVSGMFDLGGSSVTLAIEGGIADFSRGTIVNAGLASVSAAADTLMIFPEGVPQGGFGSIESSGLLHQAGSLLVVQAGKGFRGRGTIADSVHCEGWIAASENSGIDLLGGLSLANVASIDLGQGRIELDQGATGELSGTAQITAFREYIGYYGTGILTQTGGMNTIDYILSLGEKAGSSGTYELSGTGQLLAEYAFISFYGDGVFVQRGGINLVNSGFYLGIGGGGNGTYSISGGSLITSNVYVGYHGSGTLNIDNSAASISVSTLLHFGADSTFTAVPGSTIHMTGTAFENENIDPTDLAGLSNLELIYDGQTAVADPFELAGEDLGRSLDGYSDNFALHALTLGSDSILQLVDGFDNAHRGGTGGFAEALYLDELTLLSGATLDLNGLHLYCKQLDDQGASILNGEFISMMPGDVNGDWFIGGDDLSEILTNWGQFGMSREQGDLTGDGFVGGDDYTEVLTYWGTGVGLGAVLASVPEPTVLLLLSFAWAGLLRRRTPKRA